MYILRSGGCTDTDKIISRTIWQGNDDFLQRIQEKGTVNNEGYINIGSHLGLTSQRGKFTPYPSFFPPVSHAFTLHELDTSTYSSSYGSRNRRRRRTYDNYFDDY